MLALIDYHHRDVRPLAILAVLAVLGVVRWFKSLKRARLIEDTPTSRARSAAQGLVELEGVQYSPPDQSLTTPFTGSWCTWWNYKVEKRRSWPMNDHWKTIEEQTSQAPIILRDPTGEVRIHPEGAEVRPSQTHHWYSNQPPGTERIRMSLAGTGRYRYTEKCMCPGDPLYVLGQLTTMHPRRQAGNYPGAMSDLLTTWKRDQQALLARFDVNGDGEISLEEWEQVRAAAHQQITATSAHTESSEPLEYICRPNNGQPFLLAAQNADSLAGHQHSRSWLSLILAAGASALFLYLLKRFVEGH